MRRLACAAWPQASWGGYTGGGDCARIEDSRRARQVAGVRGYVTIVGYPLPSATAVVWTLMGRTIPRSRSVSGSILAQWSPAKTSVCSITTAATGILGGSSGYGFFYGAKLVIAVQAKGTRRWRIITERHQDHGACGHGDDQCG
ncbi:MAG: hypothetical protein ACYTBJ_17240, partial [Planctomycetota bacterium]